MFSFLFFFKSYRDAWNTVEYEPAEMAFNLEVGMLNGSDGKTIYPHSVSKLLLPS